jgi:hypothetical protein
MVGIHFVEAPFGGAAGALDIFVLCDIAAPRPSARGRPRRAVGLGKRREAQREDKGNQDGAHLGTSAVRNACNCMQP